MSRRERKREKEKEKCTLDDRFFNSFFVLSQ
jgi:hypothetical protein